MVSLIMNIDHLRLFVRVAALSNIRQAGEELGLSAAVASAHLGRLEETLGVRLVHRTTRHVSLSEAGRVFLPHAEEVLTSVEAAEASVGAGVSEPAGTLRMTAPASFGRQHLVPAIARFLALYPEVDIDLHLSDTIVDLVEGGFDIAIRDAELKDCNYIARKLAADRRITCASPGYLEKYGVPATPEHLKSHACISLRNLDTWIFDTESGPLPVKTRNRLKTDNGEAMRDACCAGLGITINSTWNIYQQLLRGELVPILQGFPLASDTAIWAIYPTTRLLAPKIRVFIDFLGEWFGESPYWDEGLEGILSES